MTTEGSDRISLSRETLRAELAGLELRLVDRLTAALETKADSAVVAQLDMRVASLELSRASREHIGKDLADVERRVATMESAEAGHEGERTFKRWLLPALVSVAGAGWWIPALVQHHS